MISAAARPHVWKNDAPALAGVRPLFGQVAQDLLGFEGEHLRHCLEVQVKSRARIGDILCDQGILARDDVKRVLQAQAAWVARTLRFEIGNAGFPLQLCLSLCLPAYNEENNIEDTVSAACGILPEFVERFEIIVVDDGSRDNTRRIVSRMADRDARIRLEVHEQNRGYGAAVTTGMRAARGDLVLFTDSDGQFNLLDLPQLLIRLDGHDVVAGYRYRRADSPLRCLNAWSWNWLIRMYLGVWVRDLDCAFKLFRREIVEQLEMTARGAAINAEIMAQCAGRGFRVCETPVLHYPRFHGDATGARLRVIWKAFCELPHLRRYRGVCNSEVPV